MPSKPKEAAISQEQLKSYIGIYETQEPGSDFSLTVTLEDGNFYVQKRNNKKTKVIPLSEDAFQHPYVEEEQYHFYKDEFGSMCLWGCKRRET